MTSNLDIPKMCLLLRNGIEVWVDAERSRVIADDWRTQGKGVIVVNDCYVNTVDIMGFFTPAALDDHHRRRQGQWQCKHGAWHERDGVCECGRSLDSWEDRYVPTDEERIAAAGIKNEIRTKYLGGTK